jgi:hypothetical protein
MPKEDLEARLAAVTREFVARVVQVIRNASFAEVAALPGPRPGSNASSPSSAPTPRSGPRSNGGGGGQKNGVRSRRSAAGRAEVGERVLATLRSEGRAMGVRDLSSALGMSPDALAGPLRELRAAGHVRKQGDKRATKYLLG